MGHSNPYDAEEIRKQIFANLIGGHYRMRRNDPICRPNGTRNHLLFLTLNGRGTVRQGEETFLLPPGSLALLYR